MSQKVIGKLIITVPITPCNCPVVFKYNAQLCTVTNVNNTVKNTELEQNLCYSFDT